ncbi:MAG: Lipoprotein-releasing system ATP-binding protein LolD [Phycisphaerae bacterium]|nr:Lipoprotein-releasing system ATP-binding protein LolD [Phycisphaerae bacterium]
MSEAALLRAEGLHRSFQMGRGALTVLRECSLSVAAGEFVAIMGKSGCGKSTLLHVLGALDVPQRGQVWFERTPTFSTAQPRPQRSQFDDSFSGVERRMVELRRRAFGFVFQFYHLLPELNVLENVLLARMVGCSLFAWPGARAAANRDTHEILDRVGLAGRLSHRPAELSGGERQRVAIARALVHRPRVLFADEPTGNLDAETGSSILALLRGLHRDGQTIVMVTHDSGVAACADRVCELRDGAIASARV